MKQKQTNKKRMLINVPELFSPQVYFVTLVVGNH